MEKLRQENKTCTGSVEFYHHRKVLKGFDDERTNKQPLWLLSDCWRWEKPSNLYSLSATLPTFTAPHFPATACVIGWRHFPITAGDKNQQITRPLVSTDFSCSELVHIFLPPVHQKCGSARCSHSRVLMSGRFVQHFTHLLGPLWYLRHVRHGMMHNLNEHAAAGLYVSHLGHALHGSLDVRVFMSKFKCHVRQMWRPPSAGLTSNLDASQWAL